MVDTAGMYISQFWRPEVQGQGLASSVSGEGLLHGLQTAAFSLCPLRVGGVDGWEGCGGLEQGDRKKRGGRERERERKASSSSYEDTNPIGSWPHPYDLNLTLITS